MNLFLRSSLLAVSLRGVSGFVAPRASTTFVTRTMSSLNAKPFAVIVQAEIQAERIDEFVKLIEENAVNTRKEPGCLRFDVLRSQDNPNQFWFYEVYENAAAVDFHKQQPHYNLWADFKASGGTVSSVSYKADGEFLTK
ncbi:antibiotic biosynthesis monooxygenase [Fragilaria crotonensis]|nr:antibiotic biosynthesis monooxygenase [Fragilaria crotonensis]